MQDVVLTETLGRSTRLRRAQRNILFKLIDEIGANPRQFSWEEPPDSTLLFTIGTSGHGWGGVCVLRHGQTDSIFKILTNTQALNGTILDEERYTFSYAPPPVFSILPQVFKPLFPEVFANKDPLSFKETKNYLVEWREIDEHFRVWLRMVAAAYEVVHAEEQTPDLWATLASTANVFVPTLADASNAGFSSEEISHVAQTLADLRSEVQQLGALSSVQFDAFSALLSEQLTAANRLGRKDWAAAFLGALMGVALSSAFPSDAVNKVFPLVIEKLNLLWLELQRLLS